MMKLKVVLCLVLGLFCYWFPVQHGHCSEQKPETQMQTQALASQDIRNHHKKSKKNRGNNEVELVVTEGDLLQDNIGLTVLESSSPQKQDAFIRFIDINPVTDLSFRVSESVSCRDSPATDTDTALITDPSLIGCDSTEDRQYDGHVNSFPVVQENIDVHKTGKFTKVSKDLTGQATNASHIRKEQGANVTPEIESSLPCKDQEEIPTFDEWTKIMMEVENEKSQVTHISNRIPGSSKKVQQTVTNYASVECGAKILSSNPQAKSTSAVLMENMDMYMLNPCNNKIWFVIELCQPIQVKQLDIANFEIFSSNPKDFVVLISNRYPTNKWVNLGTFHASDTRTVQSFPLDDHLFARYVKVELLSHFGSEHFCPLSLIRVFGTSMMEEYEIHSEPSESRHFQDDDNDQPPDLVPLDDKTSKNLIGSAKDAILTMVNNIAASVLGGNPENGSEDRGNCSSGDSKMAKKSLIPPSIHITESTVPVLADINKIIETTITQETALKGVIPASSASLPEASTIERPVEDVPFQSTPEVELIVTLLSDDEDESSSEQKLEKSKSDQQNSLVKESTVFSESPCSCSHVCTFQEYFLHHWSSQLFIQKRTRKSDLCCQHFISPQNKQSTLAIMIQSITQQVQTPMTEKPTLSENPITSSHQVLPVPKTESSHECGPVDLASSLNLLKPISAGCPSCQATQTIVLASPECLKSKASQPRIEKLIEPSMKPLPSILSELTGTTGILEDHCQISLTMVQSSPDNDISALTILKNKVDSSQLSSSSTSVDQPIHKLLKNKVVTGGTVPLTQPINPLDESVPSAETKSKELLDDVIPEGNTNIEQSSSEIYAGTHNSTGIQVHGSSQKESVFMRLNNRIKVLEMNMSLSGRYLEQLSQRYRKQVEEMQRAFNKTLIKLQNTSRIAEEQDHRQTDSIQMLQEQLDNITQLILNLSVSVSQLQREVSGRESYILLCLVLCALLGLLICLNHSQMSAESLPVESVSFHCPVRNSSEYIDTDLRHRAFDPLSQSSFQIPVAKADLEEATNVKQWEHAPGGTEKKQKLNFKKGPEKLSSSVLTNQSSASGFPRTTTRLHTLNLRLLSDESGPPVVTKDVISEDGCEKSSQSLETMFCGIPTCGCLCESLSGPKCCKEKKAYNHLLTPFSTTTEHLHQAVVTQCSPATEHRDTKLS